MILITFVLMVRVLQLQVIEHKSWDHMAEEALKKRDFLATTRGRILDRLGRPIAEDRPCTDACVDYRVIAREPDPEWVSAYARRRLVGRLGDEFSKAPKAQRQEMLDQEILVVRAQIDAMWVQLARHANLTIDQINETRQAIIRKVEMRRRIVWYNQYQNALKQQQENKGPESWYQRWLNDETQDAPDLDEFDIKVGEQTAAHIIVPAISEELANYLNKNQDSFPGLVLQLGTHRYYPYEDVGAHVIGQLAHVTAADKVKNPNSDELSKYWDDDLIGRSGLEALCEPLLRGKMGKIERTGGEDGRVLSTIPAVPGRDVRTTIDIELQRDIQKAFNNVLITSSTYGRWEDHVNMLGAAVVIDVPTGEALALVSVPTYDLNTLDQEYSKLARNVFEYPLLNRATQVAYEPGSTVKPMVGLGAITQGIVPPDVTIECTGYLIINGRKYSKIGRCWVASTYERSLTSVAHHPIPYGAAHPTGMLTYPDALERSCNVFFETLADKLGMEGLRYWFDRFGLGRPTGIGISEISGQIPGDRPVPAGLRASATWFSGIGQSQVLATPIQMANVAATIARDGVWKRPHLVPVGTVTSTRPSDAEPDQVDLHLSPAAVAEAKRGMYAVVNGKAGTGSYHNIADLGVSLAAKTGSAQAAPLKIPVIDPNTGQFAYETIEVPVEDPKTHEVRIEQRKTQIWEKQPIGTHEHPNPNAPWYRGTGESEDRISHAWYMGFAPADHPKIAFAVMVQYGGGGGATAGYVAKQMLEALIKHKYLQKQP